MYLRGTTSGMPRGTKFFFEDFAVATRRYRHFRSRAGNATAFGAGCAHLSYIRLVDRIGSRKRFASVRHTLERGGAADGVAQRRRVFSVALDRTTGKLTCFEPT